MVKTSMGKGNTYRGSPLCTVAISAVPGLVLFQINTKYVQFFRILKIGRNFTNIGQNGKIYVTIKLGVRGLLGSANTVQRAPPTGGAGAKSLLGSANTVWLG